MTKTKDPVDPDKVVTLYGVLPKLTPAGLIRVGSRLATLSEDDPDLFYPADEGEAGFGDCNMGTLRQSIPDALKAELRTLSKDGDALEKDLKAIRKKIVAIRDGLRDKTKIHESKREKP